jgi:hypothetical protein
MAEGERKPLPPYMPYKTFLTFLDHLRAIGMPSHIDKSVMASMSGGMQNWLRSSLRYMRLVNDQDEPDPRLEKLVAAQGDERKALLADLFRSSYGFLNGKIDLRNTTPAKLRAAISELGAQGETAEKIMAFMISMAKDANIQVSTLLTKRAPSVRRPRQRLATRATVEGEPEIDEDEDEQPKTDSAMKTIELPKSGGKLTLSGNINIFELVDEERELVFALIDTMRKFEREGGS